MSLISDFHENRMRFKEVGGNILFLPSVTALVIVSNTDRVTGHKMVPLIEHMLLLQAKRGSR